MAAANSGEAIVVGAAVGAVIGLGVGANDAVEEHDQEISDCLREKGYEVVADAAIGQAIEEIASDVGKAVKSGYEVTAEAVIEGYEYTTGQIEALIRGQNINFSGNSYKFYSDFTKRFFVH